MALACRMLLFVCLLACVVPAQAADNVKIPAPVVAVIDVQRILQESLAAKSAQKQLDVQRSKFQTDTEAEENELRQAEQDLNKSRNQLAENVYADREQKLRQRFLVVEQNVETRRKVLDKSYADSMNTVRMRLLDIVQALAHNRGVNLVMVKQQVLWSDPAFDITDEVLVRLNKDLPDMAVTAPLENK